MPAARNAAFESCAGPATKDRDGCLKTGSYNIRRCLSALKRGKAVCKFVEDWKTFKGRKWEWIELFFPLQKESVMRSATAPMRRWTGASKVFPNIGWALSQGQMHWVGVYAASNCAFLGEVPPMRHSWGISQIRMPLKETPTTASGKKRTKINPSRAVVHGDEAAQPGQAGSGCPRLGLHIHRACASRMVL